MDQFSCRFCLLGQAYSGIVKVLDPDLFDTLQITVSGLPDWLSFVDNGDGSAQLFTDSVRRDENLIGEWELAFQASDAHTSIDTVVSFYVSVMTGVPQSGLRALNVYPNPTSGLLNLDLEHDPGRETRVSFYSLSGRLVSNTAVITQQSVFDLGAFSKGFYLMVLTEKGRTVYSTKILLD